MITPARRSLPAFFAVVFLFDSALVSLAYNINNVVPTTMRTSASSRRSILQDILTKGGAAAAIYGGVLIGHAPEAKADETPSVTATAAAPLESIYIGCGCFWHLQHSVALFEREALGRGGSQLTCKTGYAGGKKGADRDGSVCYHNNLNIADYGKLGHGEVVGLELPSDKIVDATKLYFSQFNPTTKDRIDPMDLGPEYRSLMGLPGGISHPLYPSIMKVATDAGFKLKAGKGSDPDTLGKQVVYVYDTTKFPFYQAEIYHQFHNDFQSLPYGEAYENLANRALDDGRLHTVDCPDRV